MNRYIRDYVKSGSTAAALQVRNRAPHGVFHALIVALLTAFLFLRSTAGSFWTAENRFFLHWQRMDTLGVLGAILVVGLAFFAAGWMLGRLGKHGRWLRDAAFVLIFLQYARVNVAESLDAAGWLSFWMRRGMQGLQVLLLLGFLIRPRRVTIPLRNICLLASPILLIYAWTLATAPTYMQAGGGRLSATGGSACGGKTVRHGRIRLRRARPETEFGVRRLALHSLWRRRAMPPLWTGEVHFAEEKREYTPACLRREGDRQACLRREGDRQALQRGIEDGTPRAEAEHRILLIVFDEWAYARVFDEAGNVLPEFPDLARVAEQAIVYTRAYAPGTETLVSLPAIMTGHHGTSTITTDGSLWFGPQDNPRLFKNLSTVFSDFRERGCHNVMIGVYLPYADLIGHDADVCRVWDLYRFLGPSQAALAASLVIDNFRIRLSFIHPAFGMPAHYFKNRYFARLAETIHKKALKLIDQPGSLFAFIHHSVPHMPFIFDRQGPRDGLHRPATMDVADYRGNLRYTDRLIGEIFDAARSQPDGGPLLILTADHGFRFDPMWEGWPRDEGQRRRKHVPLIVVPPEIGAGRVVETPFELTDLRKLLVRWADTGEWEDRRPETEDCPPRADPPAAERPCSRYPHNVAATPAM